jgi:hypothetical protein
MTPHMTTRDDAPLWVRMGLADLSTRRHAGIFRTANVAIAGAFVAAGAIVDHQAGLYATVFLGVSAWVQTAMHWMDARRAW